MANGWADWGPREHPRPPAPVANGVEQVRYCARCDTDTLWKPIADRPTSLACQCGMTASTILNDVELDRVIARYRL